MLNSFFINGTNTEQGLVQDLINEQLKMYGIEVYYMPRQIFSQGKVIKDVIYSKFKNAFPIEAYLLNYDGFEANSVLMSKFGVRVTDEMTLIISKERFELYIAEIMKSIPNVKNALRPNSGDLIYVPLSDSLMEIKFVENRKPFYQLQKNYVYELRCEVYELEDEDINTGLTDIDQQFKDSGYNATLTLSGIGSTATAFTSLVTGGIQEIKVIDEGYGYTSTPTLVVSSPTGIGTQAKLVGIMSGARSLLSKLSLKKVYIENPGYGYSTSPSVTFFGGGGYGASIQVGIASSGSIGIVTLTYSGEGYVETPIVSFSSPVSGGTTATAEAVLNSSGGISTIRIVNAGAGYTTPPSVTISTGSTVSSGNFIFEEIVIGSISKASGVVKGWDSSTKQLKIVGMGTDFIVGDMIVGSSSSSTYFIQKYKTFELSNAFNESTAIEEESDIILDFTEVNPFGEV